MDVIHSPLSLRKSFIEHVVKPLRVKEPYNKPEETIIEVRLKNKDNHFCERVLERNVDRGRLGSLFKLLITQKYCELLYLFHTARKHYKMDEEKPFLLVTYKDINIIFMMVDGHDHPKYKRWELVPITVLRDNDKFSHNYRIDI
jgi:hypothetical protein